MLVDFLSFFFANSRSRTFRSSTFTQGKAETARKFLEHGNFPGRFDLSRIFLLAISVRRRGRDRLLVRKSTVGRMNYPSKRGEKTPPFVYIAFEPSLFRCLVLQGKQILKSNTVVA